MVKCSVLFAVRTGLLNNTKTSVGFKGLTCKREQNMILSITFSNARQIRDRRPVLTRLIARTLHGYHYDDDHVYGVRPRL
jgi:hypothetical protein